jgi:hypothetical protein
MVWSSVAGKTPALSQFLNNEKPDLVALDFLPDQIKTDLSVAQQVNGKCYL